MTSRTAPNLIDLVIAVAAAVAGAFTLSRDRLSNSIAGVAIAVALVPPLCVTGIGLSLGPEMVAVFGRGTITGLSNQVSEGSFLLFLANLIGITVASLVIFMLQRYGSLQKSLAQPGDLARPAGSALHSALISAARLQCAPTNQRAICHLQSGLDRERSQQPERIRPI